MTECSEKQSIISAFGNVKGFPGVLGALDGRLISMTSSGSREDDYENRKSFHSIILQAVCKHDRMFTVASQDVLTMAQNSI